MMSLGQDLSEKNAMNRVAGTSRSIIQTQLLVPDSDEANPEISIVVPALNEQHTIGEFVEWCMEGLRKAGVRGEILIIDSSTDDTCRIALANGARVLRAPKRGLGRAYIDAIPYIRGKFVIMGDCDCTYDFREIQPFVQKYREGYEYVMGSRFAGYIEPGAMPKLHRYFGTPLTTFILNKIYGTRFSDIHCGMRGMTLAVLKRIDLKSQGWEYASELVLKASKLRLRIAEVPIRFYKDQPGRLSHHKRMGWLSPWLAGWVNLRVMLLFNPEFFLMKPGAILFAAGMIMAIVLSGGPIFFGKIGFSLHGMFLGVTLAIAGYSAMQLGILSRVYHQYEPVFRRKITRLMTYNRGVIGGGLLIFTGLILNAIMLSDWVHGGFKLLEYHNYAIFGLLLLVLGFQTFTFTLLLHMMLNKFVDSHTDRKAVLKREKEYKAVQHRTADSLKGR